MKNGTSRNPAAGRPRPGGPRGRRSPAAPAYFVLYKPDGVMTQFTPVEGKETLAAYGPFPRDVYPVGRLDEDSEGLLLLTNDGTLQHRLSDPRYRHRRTYLVQVEREPSPAAIAALGAGVVIGGVRTLPAEVRLLPGEPALPPKRTPVRFRKTVPTAWLEMTLREGKNRQVRRMTAAAGHPALRVVRISLGPVTLGRLVPGGSRALTGAEVRELRKAVGIPARQRS
jgi:23S rRNA pseudouridine2457 synthase